MALVRGLLLLYRRGVAGADVYSLVRRVKSHPMWSDAVISHTGSPCSYHNYALLYSIW